MTDDMLKNIQKMDFETAFAALQENVAQLEKEELPLEKALSLYEVGQHLAKRCAALLEEAELRVRTLSMNTSSPEDLES
jgi:exodeoxyribonuclease VII small subunit